ncbi:DUF7544 domain-containing protein [Occallatibacter riparius]|uniref:Uncharacterized protein n=1 Tax=Occallatibacter riparius TaxID=1002689 RepID=A0A9J7BPH8_9BACT|nr:hypothetical protein [Occallatibacter riparius]UWZ84616.1 hypothetical protein MOP44_01470 [Occallatibacter riparius]
MYVLSATEAISPALNRTRDFLFRPFRWGNYLKFCAVAVLTEGMWANLQGNKGGSPSSGSGSHGVPLNLDPGMIAAVIACAILLVVLGIALMYVVVRLRFALFHSLVHRSRELAPGWHLYREQAMRFFVLSIVVAAGFLAVAAVALAPFVPGFIRVFRESQEQGHLIFGDFLPLILQLAPVIMILMLAGVAVGVVLRDFMLPHMALENATAGEAWSAVLERVMEEKGSFFLYAVLRVILPFAATIALTIVLIVPAILLFGIPGVLFALVHAAQVHSTGAAWLVMVLLQVALGILMVAIGLLMAICFGGPVSVAIRNYALVFYGGRYELLGNILAPAQTAPAAPPLPA